MTHDRLQEKFMTRSRRRGTPGFRLHGNAMYGGSFMAFALGSLNSVQVGNARGAIDEYERSW